jgi:hypothetical protein
VNSWRVALEAVCDRPVDRLDWTRDRAVRDESAHSTASEGCLRNDDVQRRAAEVAELLTKVRLCDLSGSALIVVALRVVVMASRGSVSQRTGRPICLPYRPEALRCADVNSWRVALEAVCDRPVDRLDWTRDRAVRDESAHSTASEVCLGNDDVQRRAAEFAELLTKVRLCDLSGSALIVGVLRVFVVASRRLNIAADRQTDFPTVSA